MALPLRSLTPAPPDPILGLTETYRADTRPDRVNLSVGVYVDESGLTPSLPSVLEAERRILEKGGSKGYLAIDGRPGYKKAVRDLVFGPDHEIVASGRFDGLILSGAEVTTCPELEAYVRHAASLGRFKKIQIQTNGRRLSDRGRLEGLIESGVNEFFVSIHGLE